MNYIQNPTSVSDTSLSMTALRITENLSTLLAQINPGQDVQVDPDASFSSFGLDSIQMVEMIAKLEDEFGLALEPELAFNYPTVRSLSRYIDEHQPQEERNILGERGKIRILDVVLYPLPELGRNGYDGLGTVQFPEHRYHLLQKFLV